MKEQSFLQKPLSYSFNNITIALIILNVGIYLIDFFLLGGSISRYLALRPAEVLSKGYIWQVFTYMFLHGSYSHLFFNMFGLFMFGLPLERRMGSKEYILFYLLIGTLTGIISVFINMRMNISIVGASGAIYGLLLAYATYFPDARILLFFVLPLKAPVAVLLFAGISLVLHVANPADGIAHFAHLAGLVFGFLYFIVRFNINPINIFFHRR